MLSSDLRRTTEMRPWGTPAGVLVAGCLVLMACGGSSSDGGATGSGGAGGNAASGSGNTVGTAGSLGSGGSTGSTVTAGTGGGTTTAGTGGAPGNDAGRIACGTANNNTGCNPNGNNGICDLPNNRCVQCTSDAECAANPSQMGNPYCDTVGTNMAGLPNDSCEECLTDSHCGAGMVCANNNCVMTCTGNAQCAAADPMTPICNLTGMPAQCVQCLTDTECAGVVDMNGNPRPHCRLPMTNNANECRACNTAADCQPGQTCSNGGNCNVPMDGGGFGREGGRGGQMDASAVVDSARGGD